MKHYAYLFVLSFLLVNCTSEDDGGDPNETTPGPFSVTILETYIDGADIEWTEAIDIDDDPITYSIYLNDQLISTGGTTLSYNFTGLEPETLYDGNIVADDGRGGTSEAGFFFETDPETLIFTVDVSDWIIDSFPEAGGTREYRGSGFEVPIYEGAVSYQLEIIEYSIVWIDGTIINHTGVYTWTNESHNDPVYIFPNDNENYKITLSTSSVNTISSTYDTFTDYITSGQGEAQVIITF